MAHSPDGNAVWSVQNNYIMDSIRLKESLEKLDSALKTHDVRLVREAIQESGFAQDLFAAYSLLHSRTVLHTVIVNSSHQLESTQAIVEELLRAGADINEPDTDYHGFTPLCIAMYKSKDLNLCKMLVNMGASLKYMLSYYDFHTILIVAVRSGAEFVKWVLDQDIQPSERDDQVEFVSPLFFAMDPQLCDTINECLNVFMDFYKRNNRPFPWLKAIRAAFYHKLSELGIIAILQRRYHLWYDRSSEFQEECFKAALEDHYMSVMRLLIEQQPQLVHKPWMRELAVAEKLDPTKTIVIQSSRRYPYRLTDPTDHKLRKEFLDWFKDLQSQPLPLQMICRSKILRQLGPEPETLVNCVHLPEKLKDSLKSKVI